MEVFEIIERINQGYLNISLFRELYKNIELATDEELDKALLEYENNFIESYPYLSKFTIGKFQVISSKTPNKISVFTNKKKCLVYLDMFFLLHLEFDIKKSIWEIIETHHKPTGEIFYSLGMELMDIHDSFLENIESYKNSNFINESSAYQVYSESMEFRATVIKSFIYSLTKYSITLKNELNFTEKEIIKFKDLKNNFDPDKVKTKQSKSLWNVYTRFELLRSKFPEIINSLDKITPASNRNKLLAQILGINEDTAKSLYNGNYKHDNNESELTDMNDFLNKLNKSQ